MSNPVTVMTRREETGPSSDSMIGHTRQDEPNVKIITRPWWHLVLIRAGRVFLQALFGTLTADQLGVLDIEGFWMILSAAALTSAYTLGLNLLEILKKWDTNESYAPYRA